MEHTWAIPWYIYLACQLFLASFLIQPLILLIVYAVTRISRIRTRSAPFDKVTRDVQFGIIITAHRETEFIPPIIDSLQKQSHTRFNVYVVADDCDTSDLIFPDSRIHILKPPAPLNDQMASLNFALRNLAEEDEVVVVFDPDNLAHPEYLRTVNAWYNAGYQVVCGHMQSKNKDGMYTRIDNWGAALTNFIDRDMRSLLGLSATLSGCGIAIKASLYKKISYDNRSLTGGFDKHLQLGLVKSVDQIIFANEALFYDEKIGDGASFEHQRIRWIAAYFKFLRDGFGLLITGLRRRSFNLVFFAYNLIRPPYFILLLLSCTFMVTDWFIDRRLSIAWFVSLAVYSVSFLLIVAKDSKESSLLKTLAMMITHVPRIFYRQLRALIRLKLGKKSLLKTPHSHVVYIEEILGRTAVTVAASGSQSVPASNLRNPQPGYASSLPALETGKTPDYARSRS